MSQPKPLPAGYPCCGKKLNDATEATGKDVAPKPGDYSVCAYCGEWMRYGDDLRPHLLRAEDIAEVEDDASLLSGLRTTTLLQRPLSVLDDPDGVLDGFDPNTRALHVGLNTRTQGRAGLPERQLAPAVEALLVSVVE